MKQRKNGVLCLMKAPIVWDLIAWLGAGVLNLLIMVMAWLIQRQMDSAECVMGVIKSICAGCKNRTLIHNSRYDGKTISTCCKGLLMNQADCREFKAWGVHG